jgi:hypothetical protein
LIVERISEPRSFFSQTEGTVAEQVIASSNYVQTHVLLREALQNSCDQRNPNVEFIDFKVGLHELKGKEQTFLRENIFTDCPAVFSSVISSLNIGSNMEIMTICDNQTTGLDGPIDSTDFDNYGNFLNFFLVYGQNKDKNKNGSGGSAGLGRTVLTSSSFCKTILTFSRVRVSEGIETRFMALTNEKAAVLDGKHFTGRHWWGKTGNQNQPLPIVGSEADYLADGLGLTGLLPETTGTLIVILKPVSSKKIGDESYDEGDGIDAIKSMVNAVELYAWPHLIEGSVKFSFSIFGDPIAVRDPADIPVIRDYAKAYQKLETSESESLTMNSPGNTMVLGQIAHVETRSSYADSSNDWLRQTVPDSSVALMRQARFVVKYLPVTNRNDGLATRGVFISDQSKADRIFRDSEPAAHDDWQPEKLGLKPGAHNPVKVTFTRINEYFKRQIATNAESSDGESSGAISRLFGLELTGMGSWGPSSTETGGGGGGIGGGKAKGPRIIEIGEPTLESAQDGKYVTCFGFSLVDGAADTKRATITFQTTAVTADGQKESSAPLGTLPPEILSVRWNSKMFPGGTLTIPEGEFSGEVTVIITCDQNTTTECAVANISFSQNESPK